MKWDKTEKPYRENRTGANGSQATPALGVGKSHRTGRGEYPVQTREQFETRTSAGRDSDALMGAEPLPAPPRHSRLRVPMMRRAVGGRACTAIPGSGSALARSGRRLTAGLLLAFAALLALLPEAQAQTTIKMVGNGTGSTTSSYLGTNDSGDYRELAQRFTSGSNPNGYTLSTASIWFLSLPANADVTNFVAAIYTDASNRPGTLKYPLTNPSGNFATNGSKAFSAAANSTLDPDTKYWLVLKNDNATDGQYATAVSTDSAEDSDSLAGWSIATQRFQRSSRSGSWTSWATELQIRISGYENTSTNSAPTFDDGTSTSREFNETIGDATVGTASDIETPIAATDTDTSDTLEYTLSGTDAAKFEIITASGQIQTKAGETYSYETDTSYAVTVTVEDDNGGSATIDVTLNVTNQDEPPLRPVAPTVRGPASNSTTSLRVTMTAPDNSGRPPITRYKLRTHRDGFGWSNLPYNPSSAQNITGITSGKRYHVQFRVKNDEGEGPWSPTAFGYTKAHASGMPDISGTARVGRTLTAGTSGISDGNGKSKAENGDVGFAYTYQWVRVDGGTETDISGETANTYTLAMADLGKTVKVTASFKDNAGYAEGPLTSDAYPSSGTIALLELSFPSDTINVDEEAGPAMVTVNLAPAGTETVTVDYATRDFSAEEGEDYTATSGTLTFAPGETSKTITIPILNDDIYEGLEKFFVDLSNPSGTALPATPTKAVEIASDDAVPTASLAPVTVDEGAGTMTLTLRVSHPSEEDVTYTAFSDNVMGTATSGDDYDDFLLDGGVARIAVPAGNLSKTFNISIVNDDLEETDETILIAWQRGSNNAVTPTVLGFTGTIEDDDEGAGAARGKPKITGTAEVGRTLTANTSGILDQNGNTKAENGDAGFAYTYQWYRVDAGAETPITGASGRGSTYTLLQADEGKTFRVAVSFTDDAGNSEGPLTSNEYPADAENGELQLVDDDGPTVPEGRLEVFHNGEWGTVCDDRLDNRRNIAPQKACQFMGYATGHLIPRGTVSRAPDSQPIWLDDVRCFAGSNHWTGAPAEKLHHCYHAGWGNNNCSHDENVHLSCTGVSGQTEATPLTATLEDLPTNHDGSSAFSFQIAFSADVDITPENMRDHALTVSGATVTNASRVDGRSDLWELTVEPAGTGAVSILVPLNRACTETGALCTAQGGMLTIAPAQSIPGLAQGPQAPGPLTASFVSVPTEHDGDTEFWLELSFDAAVEQGSKPHMEALLGVSRGSVTRLRRKDDRLDHWRVRIEPSSHEAVTVTLSPSPPCGTTGAVCTDDGRTFTTALATQIQGPPGLSVADAEVQEAANATLAFAVTLSRAPSGTVTVDYATADGTATAGSDYTATSGTLTFAAGETEKAISVPVLDDGHDEGSETLTLTLSNPSGAYLADGSATGTINNSDPMPLAWMVRFGRTVGSQVVDALGQRLDSATASHVTIGGINLTGEPGAVPMENDDPFALPEWTTRSGLETDGDDITTNDLLLGSAFQLLSGGSADNGPSFTAWGRVARSGFEAEVDDVTMDGDVTSGLIGFDAEWERLLAGVMLSQSSGEGSYRLSEENGGGTGTVESSLTGIYPYARLELNRQVSAWALAGMGSGDLTLQQEGDKAMPTDITMRMGALGVKGQVLDGTGPSGLAMNVKSDAMWVGTKSERTTDLIASEGNVSRLRLIVEGKRTFEVASGARITPSAELGLRHDAGDAETGTGLEVGAGLSYAAGPLTVEGQVRMLVAHEESGYEEWGASGAMRITPSTSGRGLTLSIAPEWGRTGSAAERLWSARDASGLGADRVFEGDARLALDAGYGVGVGRGVLTPYAGLTLGDARSRTVRTGTRWQVGADAVLGLEGTRRTSGIGEADNHLMLRIALRF